MRDRAAGSQYPMVRHVRLWRPSYREQRHGMPWRPRRMRQPLECGGKTPPFFVPSLLSRLLAPCGAGRSLPRRIGPRAVESPTRRGRRVFGTGQP
jgi:hypothetical protein